MGQSTGLMGFIVLGLGLGFVYDILRPPRYGTKAGWIFDGLFCALAAFAYFLMNMANGSCGIWETSFLLLAFCTYIHLLSPFVLPKLLKIHSFFLEFSRLLFAKSKKICLFIKKLFSKT